MAPEVSIGKYDHKVDMFSFGAILYKLITNQERNHWNDLHLVFKEIEVILNKNTEFPPEFLKLTLKLLSLDPKDRPDAKKAHDLLISMKKVDINEFFFGNEQMKSYGTQSLSLLGLNNLKNIPKLSSSIQISNNYSNIIDLATKQPLLEVSDVQMPDDENDLWSINKLGSIFKMVHGMLKPVEGNCILVTFGDKSSIWCINSRKCLFTWNGSGWAQVNGEAPEFVAIPDGTVVITNNIYLYRWNGLNWILIECGSGYRSPNVGINTEMYEIFNMSLKRLEGCFSQLAEKLSHDKQQVYEELKVEKLSNETLKIEMEKLKVTQMNENTSQKIFFSLYAMIVLMLAVIIVYLKN